MGFFNQILIFFQFLVAVAVATAHLLLGGTTSLSITSPLPSPPATTTIAASTKSTSTTTSLKSAAIKPAPKTATTLPNVSAVATTPPPQQPIAAQSAEEVNANTRASLVNILCTTAAGGSFAPISGSGVIIDSRGIVLTNAHVGQFFLLRDYGAPGNINCILRTGSPAQAAYTAELLYLPPVWIDANVSEINSQHATGTGENDYSFLRITGTTGPGITLPASFPALAMTATTPDDGDQMLLAAYPAGFFGGETIQLNLYITSAIAVVQQLYTYNDPTHVDAIDVGGTVVSQSGASGGAVVRLTDGPSHQGGAEAGKLVGIISTDTASSTTAGRELDAITIAHIDRSLADEGQGGIVQLLTGDLAVKAANFATTTAPSETKKLEDVLNKQ
ncbi:MAG: trypsin-like peptidase domain-containing protein [Patescibacteria group bacterium]|nr:trypsin-like peptidase domain-containing protein [Patescibacteria group bacterium]